MRHHAPPPHFLQPLPLDQPAHGVERAARLECADALEVLALEEEFDLRARGRLALPRGAFEGFGRLRRRCEGGERGVGLHGREVDVWLDEGVGGDDGGAC